MTSHLRVREFLGAALVTAVAAFASGCGSGKAADLDKAKEVVTTALDQWKAGSTPKQLATQSITITDPDWQAGYRLAAYTVKTASEQPQQGPRVVAVLTLLDRAGRKSNKEVGYEVDLKDKITIGRDPFHIGQ